MAESTEAEGLINQARRGLHFFKNNVFREYYSVLPKVRDIRRGQIEFFMTHLIIVAVSFYILQIILFASAFLLFILMFSKLYQIFYDLVEVLMYFEPIEASLIRHTNRTFLELMERTSSGAVSQVRESFTCFKTLSATKKKAEVSEANRDIGLLNFARNRRSHLT